MKMSTNMNIIHTFAFISAVVFILVISIGGYFLVRSVNYKFSYESQVQKTVCQMVSEEYLKVKC